MKKVFASRVGRIAPLMALSLALSAHAVAADGLGGKVVGAGKGAGKETKEAVTESGTEVWGATRDALVTLLSLPVRLAQTIGSGGESTQERMRRDKAAKQGAAPAPAPETGELNAEERQEVESGFARLTGYLAGMAGGVTEETTGPTFDALKGLGGAAVATLKQVIVLPFRILNSAATGGESAGVGQKKKAEAQGAK